jgi:hypothetical protein
MKSSKIKFELGLLTDGRVNSRTLLNALCGMKNFISVIQQEMFLPLLRGNI